MFRYLFALLILTLSSSVKGEDKVEPNRTVDSLNTVIEKNEHDTLVAAAYLSLVEVFYLQNLDTIIPLGRKALTIAESYKNRNNASPEEMKMFDAIYINAYNTIGFGYNVKGIQDTALYYYRQSLLLAQKTGDKASTASGLNNIGYLYYNLGKTDSALHYFLGSLEIKRLLNDPTDLALGLNNVASMYNSMGEIDKAMAMMIESYELSKSIDDKSGIGTSGNNIANVLEKSGRIDEALKYYFESLQAREEIGDDAGISICYNNLSSLYADQGDFKSAKLYILKSLALAEKMGNALHIGYRLHNLGSLFLKMNENDSAKYYLNKCLELREKTQDYKGMPYTLAELAKILLDEGKLNEALVFYQRSIAAARKSDSKIPYASALCGAGITFDLLNQPDSALFYAAKSLTEAEALAYPKLIQDASALISRLQKKAGNYEEALLMYEQSILMRDSVVNEKNEKAVIRQQTKYEFEKAQLLKEQEERDLDRIEKEATSRRDNLQYSVIFISILALFGGVLALGFINVSERMAEGIIFFSFLILFEFLLVLADPTIEEWSGGAPGIKLLFNAGIAALIFPAHAFFETKLKGRLVKK